MANEIDEIAVDLCNALNRVLHLEETNRNYAYEILALRKANQNIEKENAELKYQNMAFKEQRDLFRKYQGRFSCNYCDSKFDIISVFFSHMKKEHKQFISS